MNTLYRLYKCINSSKVFFAYLYSIDQNTLTFWGVKEGNDIQNISDSRSIAFSIIGGQPYIKIYYDRQRIADYSLSESSGEWILRFQNDLSNKLQECVDNITENNKRLLSLAIMDIANKGHGAMLLITKDPGKLSESQAPCKLNDAADLREAIEAGYLFNYASYDGAVIIRNENATLSVSNFGVILNPKKKIPRASGYNTLLRASNSGSRHEKAVRYACENPSDCLIVISENRTVSILKGPTPIYWRDEDEPMELVKQLKKGGKIK